MALHSFSRTELLIGKEGLDKLSEQKVAIFGIGGVGTSVLLESRRGRAASH